MADYAIHDTTLIGTSNIIRKKEGSSALIDPADYPKRINLMGMLEEKTASGAVAHFEDGADAVPLKSLVVSIVPIGGKGTPQSPIPISGVDEVKITHTGKNMLNPATCQRGYIEGNGNIHVAQAYQELYSDYIKVKPDTTYTFSGTVNNSSDKWCGIAYYDKDKNFIIRQEVTTGTGEHFSIGYRTPSNTVYVRCTWRNYSDISSGGSVCPCQLEEGTETEYDAYNGTIYDVEFPNPNTNLRPSAEVDDGMWTDSGTINPSSGGGFGRALTIAVSEKTSYDIYGLLDDLIVYLDSNKTMISYERLSNASASLQDERKTTPANCAYIGLSALAFDVSSVSVKESFFVYVGQYDAISGTLTITHIMRTYNTADMDNNNEIYAGWRSANIRDVLGTGLNQRFSNQTVSVGTAFSANTMGANDLLMLPQSLYGLTQTEWQALALDVQICLPLLTPIVIQLEPIAIDSKAGSNNIWNDAGDSEVTYRSQGTTTPILPTLVTKTITENGTYSAEDDDADGYSEVTVNVETIPKLTVHEGELNISNGTITTSSTYCYTEPFDCHNGTIVFDCGEQTSAVNVGLELINADNSHANYFTCASRYREVDISQYYSATKKARLAFKKANLSKVLLMDFGNGKIYSSLSASQFEETQANLLSMNNAESEESEGSENE